MSSGNPNLILNPCPECGEVGTAIYEYHGDPMAGPVIWYLRCNLCGYIADNESQHPEDIWNDGDQPKIAIIIPEKVRMSAGKLASQAVHAALRVGLRVDYSRHVPICVVLSASGHKMSQLVQKCDYYRIPYSFQMDAGYTEVDEGTVTAMAIGPAPESVVNMITERLRLMKG